MNASNASDAAQTFATDVAEPWYPYVLTLYLTESAAVFVGNVLVMVAYKMTPQLQSPPNLLIFNMSLIDSMVPFCTFAWAIFSYTEAGLRFVVRDKWACLTTLGTTTAISTSSMVAILFLSLDRFLAVLLPYAYYRVVTDRSVKAMNIIAWVFPIVLHGIPLFKWNTWAPGKECTMMHVHHPVYSGLVANGARATVLISTAVMNIAVCIVAFRKKASVIDNPPPEQATPQPPRHDFKLTKMLLTVFGAYFITWAPYLGLTVYTTMRRGLVPAWLEAAQDFSVLGVGLNSMLNPVIYARKNDKFRAAFKKILFRRNTNDVAPTEAQTAKF